MTPTRKKPKFSVLYLDPTPASIPSRETGKLLEEYIATPHPPESAKGTAFGKYKENRKVFISKSITPGPGSYVVSAEKQVTSSG